jgi:hypothetical protein
MADDSKPISDDCLAFAADCIQAIVKTTLREQYTEVVVLSVAIKALKQAHPKEAAVVDKLLAELRDSVDIKAQVDSKIAAISKNVPVSSRQRSGRGSPRISSPARAQNSRKLSMGFSRVGFSSNFIPSSRTHWRYDC